MKEEHSRLRVRSVSLLVLRDCLIYEIIEPENYKSDAVSASPLTWHGFPLLAPPFFVLSNTTPPAAWARPRAHKSHPQSIDKGDFRRDKALQEHRRVEPRKVGRFSSHIVGGHESA